MSFACKSQALSPLFEKLFIVFKHGNEYHYTLKLAELDQLLFDGAYGIENNIQSGKKAQHFMMALVRAFAKMNLIPSLGFLNNLTWTAMSNGVKFMDGFMGRQNLIEEQVLELLSNKNYALANTLGILKATDPMDARLFEEAFIFQAKQVLNDTRSTVNQGHLKKLQLDGKRISFLSFVETMVKKKIISHALILTNGGISADMKKVDGCLCFKGSDFFRCFRHFDLNSMDSEMWMKLKAIVKQLHPPGQELVPSPPQQNTEVEEKRTSPTDVLLGVIRDSPQHQRFRQKYPNATQLSQENVVRDLNVAFDAGLTIANNNLDKKKRSRKESSM